MRFKSRCFNEAAPLISRLILISVLLHAPTGELAPEENKGASQEHTRGQIYQGLLCKGAPIPDGDFVPYQGSEQNKIEWPSEYYFVREVKVPGRYRGKMTIRLTAGLGQGFYWPALSSSMQKGLEVLKEPSKAYRARAKMLEDNEEHGYDWVAFHINIPDGITFLFTEDVHLVLELVNAKEEDVNDPQHIEYAISKKVLFVSDKYEGMVYDTSLERVVLRNRDEFPYKECHSYIAYAAFAGGLLDYRSVLENHQVGFRKEKTPIGVSVFLENCKSGKTTIIDVTP